MKHTGFGGLVSTDTWQRLVDGGAPRRFQPGECIVRQGELGTHVVLLVNGTVKVARSERNGREILLALRGRGEALGEMSVLDGGGRSASVIAVGVCDTAILTADRFQKLIDELDLSAVLLRHVLGRYRESEELHAEALDLQPAERIARCLQRLVAVTGPELNLTQGDLAKAVGLARSTLASEIAVLRQAGVVDTQYGRLMVRHPESLRTWRGSHDPLSGSGHSS
ncbi:Crp/Fnr family transcriptional regulator [Nocardia thraciensis]